MGSKIRWFLPRACLALMVVFSATALSILFSAAAVAGRATGGQLAANSTGISLAVESRLVSTSTVRYVDRPVTELKYIARVERVPVTLREYNDLDELEQWLAKISADANTVYFNSPGTTPDCDDFALELQQKALEDGYVMSFQIIKSDSYNSLFKRSKLLPDTVHAINLVVIGNSAYYIEPQSGEIAFVLHLD
jgi:hypothetical protein